MAASTSTAYLLYSSYARWSHFGFGLFAIVSPRGGAIKEDCGVARPAPGPAGARSALAYVTADTTMQSDRDLLPRHMLVGHTQILQYVYNGRLQWYVDEAARVQYGGGRDGSPVDLPKIVRNVRIRAAAGRMEHTSKMCHSALSPKNVPGSPGKDGRVVLPHTVTCPAWRACDMRRRSPSKSSIVLDRGVAECTVPQTAHSGVPWCVAGPQKVRRCPRWPAGGPIFGLWDPGPSGPPRTVSPRRAAFFVCRSMTCPPDCWGSRTV